MTQQINISDETYNAIAVKHGDVEAFVENAAKQVMAEDLAESLAMIRLAKCRSVAPQLLKMPTSIIRSTC